ERRPSLGRMRQPVLGENRQDVAGVTGPVIAGERRDRPRLPHALPPGGRQQAPERAGPPAASRPNTRVHPPAPLEERGHAFGAVLEGTPLGDPDAAPRGRNDIHGTHDNVCCSRPIEEVSLHTSRLSQLAISLASVSALLFTAMPLITKMGAMPSKM